MKTRITTAFFHHLAGIMLLAVLLLLLINPLNGISQQRYPEESLFVTNYSLEDGMRQSMVSQLYQDHRGLMWMVTGDGLHCFDGKEFRVFRVPYDGYYNHSDNLMRDISNCYPDNLTLASTSSILNFNVATGAFNSVYRSDGSYPMLLNFKIGKNQAAWLHSQKLCVVKDNKIIPVRLGFSNRDRIPTDFSPTGSARYNSKEILIINNNGILIINQASGSKADTFDGEWMEVTNCQAVTKDRKGRIFILADGIIRQYLGNGRMKYIFNTGFRQKIKMFIDSKDNFWIWSGNSPQLFRLTNNVLTGINMLLVNGKHIDPILPNIITVFEDNHGNLWFGTDSDGAIMYSPDKLRFDLAAIGFVRCLTWFGNHLWAGTHDNGLWKLSSDLLNAERIRPEKFTNNIYFLDFATDSFNRLWIATRKGVEVIDDNGNTLFSLHFDSYSSNFLFSRNDTLTLASDTRLFYFKTGSKPELIKSSDFVPTYACIEAGNVRWFGNQFGLYRSTDKFSFDKYCIFNDSNRISYNNVNSLIFHQGKIWSASGNGIELFDLSGKPLPVTGSINELKNEVIYSLIPDETGRIWFTCNQGIGCILTENEHIIWFNAQNNLQSLEFNYNAECKAPFGRIYFGGIRGVNGFSPYGFNPGKETPEVRMIELYIGDSLINKGISPAYLRIALGREAPHINGKVFCSDFSDAGAQLYSFYLEGYQLKWSKPSSVREFSYRDLPPGKYRLFAKCADAWHNWSKPVVLLTITLKPPFWKTSWFLILVILFIATLTALVVRRINSIRYRRHIRELEHQHAIEKERLRISKDMHDEVGASLTRISILSELAKNGNNDPAKTRHVVSQISEIAGDVVDEMSEIIWAMNPRNDSLDSFAAYVRRFASLYLDASMIDVVFDFPAEVPVLPMSSELRRNLFLTVKEAFHNIVKHAGADKVHFTLKVIKDKITIEIKDNGKGFDHTVLNNTGNGLHNMQRRVEDSGGTYLIHSALQKGTSIEFTIAL